MERFLGELLFAGIMAAAINVAGQGLFRLNAWITLSKTVFAERYLGKALVTFLIGFAVAFSLDVDFVAPLRAGGGISMIGKFITGLTIGGGSNSIQLLASEIGKIYTAFNAIRTPPTPNAPGPSPQ